MLKSYIRFSCRQLNAYPKGNKGQNFLSLFLEVACCGSLPSGWRRHARFRLIVVNQRSETLSRQLGMFFSSYWSVWKCSCLQIIINEQYHKHKITNWTVTIPYNMFHPRLVLDKTWWNIRLGSQIFKRCNMCFMVPKIWKNLLWIYLKNNYDPINVRELGPDFITSSNDWNLLT